MRHLSPGLSLAWRIAASEAGVSGYPKIECAHLLMGLLSLDKASPRALRELGFDPTQLARIEEEQSAIETVFASASAAPPALRRDLRAQIRKRSPHAKGVMSRSASAKAAFSKASQVAAGRDANALHLLSVLLREGDPLIDGWMSTHGLGQDLAVRAEIAATHPFEGVVPGKAPATAPTTSEPSESADTLPFRPAVEPARLLKLEAHLKSRIIGQDEALAKVAARVKAALVAQAGHPGPLASFLFVGPPGVGKTETARTIATYLFKDAEALLRFDMAEFADAKSAPRLLGAGSGGGGQLAEALHKAPDSVVLFADIEKAHPKVLEGLLQVLAGTPLAGGAATVRRAIVVMTSHLKVGSEQGGPRAGAKKTGSVTRTIARSRTDLGKLLQPEVLERIDDVVNFSALSETDVRRITRPLLAAVATNTRKAHGVFLRFEPDAEGFIVRLGLGADKGLRELKATIEKLVETPLVRLAASGKLAKFPSWKAAYDDGGIYLLPES